MVGIDTCDCDPLWANPRGNALWALCLHVLRYVGSVDAQGRAQVGLVELPKSHPFANIALTDNIVRFETARYDKNPLIVQGPGAGPAVTAAGIYNDLLRLVAERGASRRVVAGVA